MSNPGGKGRGTAGKVRDGREFGWGRWGKWGRLSIAFCGMFFGCQEDVRFVWGSGGQSMVWYSEY